MKPLCPAPPSRTLFFFLCFFFAILCSARAIRHGGFDAEMGDGKQTPTNEARDGLLPQFREAPAFRNGAECSSSRSKRAEDVTRNRGGGDDEDEICDDASVHVAMTLDVEYIRGSVAAILSIVKHTVCPENVIFHFLAMELEEELSGLLRATFPYLRYKVYSFDEGLVRGRISASVRKALEQPLNYARAYASDILPPCVRRIIYLDSDVVVVDDIQKLWLIPLSGHAIGAPEYCNANFSHYFTDAFWSDPSLSSVFAVSEQQESEPDMAAPLSLLEQQESMSLPEQQESIPSTAQQESLPLSELQESVPEMVVSLSPETAAYQLYRENPHLRGSAAGSLSVRNSVGTTGNQPDRHKRRLAVVEERRRGRRKPCYFNTGVMVMDMEMWRSEGYSREIERWMEVQRGGGRDEEEAAKGRIYELGSLPPFLLVFAGDVKAVEQKWNQHGLGGDNENGHCRDLHPGPVSLLHWSGKGKPWIRLDAHNPCPLDALWAPYDLQLR